MLKKTQKNAPSGVEVRPALGTAAAAVAPALGSVETISEAVESSEGTDPAARSGSGASALESQRLFALYVARIATIDRYRVPISDKGLPTAYRKALEEAKMALEVFNSTNER